MPAEMIQDRDLAQAEARLPRWMAAVAAAGTIAAFLLADFRASLGFALGAGLALLNYRWLHEATGAIFSGGRERVPRVLVARFAVRYPLAFGGLYLFYKTGWLPVVPLIAGMFVPVAGAMIEGVVQISGGLRRAGPA